MKVIREKRGTKGDLDTLEEQLNHAAYVIPLPTFGQLEIRNQTRKHE